MNQKEKTFSDSCKEFLRQKWEEIKASMETGQELKPLSPKFDEIKEAIGKCLRSKAKSYHYVLPTQILCKCVNPSLDCHALQTAYEKSGAFDARTIAHQVIVPFDQENHRALGGSEEPYVNNPLRFKAVIPDYRDQQKYKNDWDNLITVLDIIEEKNNPDFTKNIFDQILIEVFRLLSGTHVIYPTPNRVRLPDTIKLITDFISIKSGGERTQAVGSALFRAISFELKIFDEIKSHKVNTSDSSSGLVADIECWANGKIALLVEIKDRSLTLTQINSKLDSARSKRISEILFLAEGGAEESENTSIKERITNEFSSGQNIYIANLIEFILGILILFGEKGRVVF